MVHGYRAARNDLVHYFDDRRAANPQSARPNRRMAELRGLGRDAHALVFVKGEHGNYAVRNSRRWLKSQQFLRPALPRDWVPARGSKGEITL